MVFNASPIQSRHTDSDGGVRESFSLKKEGLKNLAKGMIIYRLRTSYLVQNIKLFYKYAVDKTLTQIVKQEEPRSQDKEVIGQSRWRQEMD